MKLIGNGKKDYFDYLIHQYGEDPLVVLDRRPIGEFVNLGSVSYYKPKQVDKKYHMSCGILRKDHKDRQRQDKYISDFLILNGKSYPLAKVGTKYELINEENCVITNSRYFSIKDETVYDYYTPKEETLLIELSKEINRHCFIIRDVCSVSGEFPCLSAIGIPSIKTSQEVYLETVDFIAKHFAKEGEVSVPQTNKEKIVGHGFDLKTSFRGK